MLSIITRYSYTTEYTAEYTRTALQLYIQANHIHTMHIYPPARGEFYMGENLTCTHIYIEYMYTYSRSLAYQLVSQTSVAVIPSHLCNCTIESVY